ncbi:MAG TPA: prolipoprotein diacylglyceryl transferase family protein, partial [Polyangiaceae bacterium]|nr:prolipoprotein diacylglyceryl transferase family protein [Polyangiaceae bacterium]
LGGRLVTIVLYTLGFFVALPAALLRLGQRADDELGLAPPLQPLSTAFGGVLLVGGAALLVRSAWELWQRGKGLPISHLPPERLVVTGPFHRLRHPIYVAYTLALSGTGFLLGSWGVGCIASMLLVAAWTGYAHSIEEPRLLRRFGAEYQRYAARTQLLPLPRPLVAAAAGGLARSWQALRPAVSWLASHTVLFRIGPALWVGYGAWLAVGTVIAGWVGLGLLAAGMPAPAVAGYLVGISLAMVIGGRLAWLAYEYRALRAAPGVTLRRVGFVSFGAYAAMFLFALGWSRWHASGLSPGWLLDRTMAACLLCSGFGRLGCLSYGCCYGRAWRHGICYRDARAKVVRELGAAGAEPRVPAQLLSALLAFAVALAMLLLLGLGAAPGFATALGALCYALARFHAEALREERRLLDGRLTRGQLLSMSIAAAALGWLAFAPPGAVTHSGLTFAWAALGQHLAMPLVAALPVFLICGYHRAAVGQW